MRRVNHVHFVGIGGAGMSGIAEVLHNLGYAVSGSDLHESHVTERLRALGIHISTAHHGALINGSDVVVYSSAILKSNPELIAARAKRIPIIPRAEMLSELMRFRQGIAVAGTHGKTTTTSLIASLFAEGALDPTYVIGGRLNSTGAHAKLGEGDYLIAEADESDASFLHLQPVYAVLTNIDADHLVNYEGSYEKLQHHFVEFLYQLPFYGLIVMCSDDQGVQGIVNRIHKPYVTYGIHSDADYKAISMAFEGLRSRFTISRRKQKNTLEVTVNLPGRHNVLNALAAVALASELGVCDEAIVNGLSGFQGIARRSALLGEIEISGNKLLLVDDYAHHPGELSAMIDAIHQGWPDRRCVMVFQPHRYTRTRDHFSGFCEALSDVDVLILLDVYPAGEAPIPGADAHALSEAIARTGKTKPVYVKDKRHLFSVLNHLVEDKDILLLLGAGDISALGDQLLAAYKPKAH